MGDLLNYRDVPSNCTSIIQCDTVVLYIKDHKGWGVAHEITSPKIVSVFLDNNEAVLVRKN